MTRAGTRRWLALAVSAFAFVILIANTGWWQIGLHFLFPGQTSVVYERASLLALVARHLELVAVSSGLTILLGLPLGIWVTRRSGMSFLPLVNDVTSFGQTFPPVAVLAVAVPVLGFGLAPTIVALFLYGLLPVVRNTIAGLRSVSTDVLNVSFGMGMSRWQTLRRVEIPLAAPVIIGGIRTSVIINIGTAMIGAVIGAGGLGLPVVSGLVQNNVAYVIEGALPAAILAVLVDQLLANVERAYSYPGGAR